MSIVLDGTTGLAGAATGALNGALGATTPSTVVATTVVASSTIKGASTIAVGNATPSASGAGITFPATQSASTDANTLDDYEEGLFTPTLTFGSTAQTSWYDRHGRYTKVGNLVTAIIWVEPDTPIATGNLIIGNLPFTASSTENINVPASIYVSGWTYGGMAAFTQLTAIVIAGTTTMYMYNMISGSTSAPRITGSTYGRGCRTLLSVSYYV